MKTASESCRPDGPADAQLLLRFFVSLWLILLVARTFILEPNEIPTGSMAPTRLGRHFSLTCDKCKFSWPTGIMPDGSWGEATCPNCGWIAILSDSIQATQEGDRVWVSKPAYHFFTPERFDEVIFYSPDAPLIPHIKRIAGLPGEKIQIKNGDIFINEKRVQKSENHRRAMSPLVFDQHYFNLDLQNADRWHYSPGASGNWKIEPGGTITFQRNDVFEMQEVKVDYRHFLPDRQEFGFVNDFLAYNGRNQGIDHEVEDLWFSVTIQSEKMQKLSFRITNRNLNIEIRWTSEVSDDHFDFIINNQVINPELIKAGRRINPTGQFQLELSVVDRQLDFFINNREVIYSFSLEEFEPRMPEETLRISPAGFCFIGEKLKITDFRLYRDIYYSDRTADEPVKGIATDQPVEIPADHFFVLGDNSQMSLDSRFWRRGIFVHRSAIIGKPLFKGRRN